MNTYTYFVPKQGEDMIPNRYRRVGKTKRVEFWEPYSKRWIPSYFDYFEPFIESFNKLAEKPADWQE